MSYFTKKQVRALNRRLERIGEGPIKVGTCRRVNNRGVTICHTSRGYTVAVEERPRSPGGRSR